MKADLPALVSLAMFALSGSLLANLLPENKVPVVLQEGERNPFAAKAAPVASVVPADQESEESRIRGLLMDFDVVGFSDGPGGTSVLLGPYLLRPGEMVPQLVNRQTERIQVAAIHNGRIELVFLEDNDRPPTRRISLGFSTKPRVRFLLGTQLPPVNFPKTLQGSYPTPTPPANEPSGP